MVKYTDDLLDKIHMALKVPKNYVDRPRERQDLYFEPYVRYLQTMVEGAAMNAQLMPLLENGEAKV